MENKEKEANNQERKQDREVQIKRLIGQLEKEERKLLDVEIESQKNNYYSFWKYIKEKFGGFVVKKPQTNKISDDEITKIKKNLETLIKEEETKIKFLKEQEKERKDEIAYDLLFKIFIVSPNDSEINKISSSIMTFDHYTLPQSFKLGTKTVQTNDRICKLQCWIFNYNDLERIYSVNHHYIDGTHGAILLVNIGDGNSFKPLPEWISLIRERGKSIPILLVGNRPKDDWEKQISEREAKEFAREYMLADYMEIASHSGYNTSIMFEKITSLVLEHFYME